MPRDFSTSGRRYAGNIARLHGLGCPTSPGWPGRYQAAQGHSGRRTPRWLLWPLHSGFPRKDPPRTLEMPAFFWPPSRFTLTVFRRIVMDAFERRIGRRHARQQKAASGTEIMNELGPEHSALARPCVYLGRRVFRSRRTKRFWPVPDVSHLRDRTRHSAPAARSGPGDRAGPSSGGRGAFTRTANRHDYAIAPPPGMLPRPARGARVFVQGSARSSRLSGPRPGRSVKNGIDNADGTG